MKQGLKGSLKRSQSKIDAAKSLPPGCGVLFPKGMGNYAHNSVAIRQIFQKLRAATSEIQFLAYHP